MSEQDVQLWQEMREPTPERVEAALRILDEVKAGEDVMKATRRNPLKAGGLVPKSVLVTVYKQMVDSGQWQPDNELLRRIRMKPVRTLSGVTTVTVLTKPYPCPGKCIFCPTDARMPKSYLPDEPGAMRGLQNDFDPYRQVRSRLEALEATGHPTDKIELLILGGTWSAYRRDYQQWFIHRCFDALNEVETETLEEAQRVNETAPHRNVGLVIETRPDEILGKPLGGELAWLRSLGVTKVQMGAQSLDDRVLALNKRGHTAAQTLRAVALLRAAGFKIVLHWMPNLLGATLDSDRADFARLWDGGYCPDEIKIYPCQLLANAELYEYWQRGEYTPYTQDELIHLIADIKPAIPVYCRVNRIIRDIPSTNVVAGNKRTSLRMDVFAELKRRGEDCRCIRCREVRGEKIDPARLRLVDTVYTASSPDGVTAEEHFLQFVTPNDKIAGYLRLSLPQSSESGGAAPDLTAALPDLKGAALIREVHVYGQSLAVGEEQPGAAQHIGLGTRLLDEATRIARERGFSRLAVIAAIGTRLYYESRGFERGELYLIKRISPQD
ncbi:MAG: tRNA uridine(34) 5-carboxymethylaminomethyl modification radical SAM/GNAT enzyme Elp3 [Chloroflexi bacterium]|nr:tRNA uridine(34) 5-carboxymethylaminomethyl modification radical SAM/GNAT enzyme Elp3 [Chloroflexota bacterium]